jgi:nicotinate-nucleotide adenylyltransferase
MVDEAKLSELWFVVSPQNPFKQNEHLLDDGKRLELVKAALERYPNLIPSDYEFHLSRPSYMYNTLESLERDYPEREFVLLIGADNWQRFGEWYRNKDILDKHDIYVFPRRGINIEESLLPGNVKMLHIPLINISSTEIRKRIIDGKPFKDMLPAEVSNIIEKDNLY